MRREAAAVAVLLALAACSAGTAAPAASGPAGASSSAALPTVREPAAAVPGMTAEAVQLRTDAAAGGRFQVRLSATEEFTVTSVALDSPGFEPLPPTRTTATFRPGRTIDLRTPFGAVRCDVSALPASARLTVTRPGARAEEVDVPLDAEVLERIHADACAEEALFAQVSIAVRDLRDDGDGLAGALVLERRSGEGSVAVVALRRSVLVEADVDLPLTMDAGADEATGDLRFAPATCDAHVLAETKQPFLFPMTVQVGEEQPVDVELPVPDDLRAQLQALVQRVCR